MININLERYFLEQFCEWDKINCSSLDPGRRLYRIKFIQIIEEILNKINIELQIERARELPTKQQLENIDQNISHALNKVYKIIEGLRRGVPYSKEKVKQRATLLC